MNPQHHNPQQLRSNGNWAHAPYNFVPLPEKIVTVEEIPSQARYDHFTGYIDCTLQTSSPLYVRCASSPQFFNEYGEKAFNELTEEQKNERAQFFNTGDPMTPVIPGSSLRGMIRALVEIAGYSAVQWVSNEHLVFRAVGDMTSLGNYYRDHLMRDGGANKFTPLMHAGYMEQVRKNQWVIRPAKEIDGTTFARINNDDIPTNGKNKLLSWYHCRNARKIWVMLGPYSYQEVRGGFIHIKYTPVVAASTTKDDQMIEGVLAYSGEMKNKKHEIVLYPPDYDAEVIKIAEDIIYIYKEQVTRAQEDLLGPNGALIDHQPVFYITDDQGNLIFFGHTLMFRIPYDRTPLDFVPESLRSAETWDIADAIFGRAPNNRKPQQLARAGRIFFSDAILQPGQEDIWLPKTPIIVPKILSSPKPTTFQHYLAQQEPDYVDTGKKDKNGYPKFELQLDHYASPPPHDTVIRGHKLYWHQNDVDVDAIREGDVAKINKAKTQYTRVMPVRSGIIFTFRIWFENLRDFELGSILWSLRLPGEDGVEYRHKLGMGKPLGMGSVHLVHGFRSPFLDHLITPLIIFFHHNDHASYS